MISVFGFRHLGGGGVLFSGKKNRYTPNNKTNTINKDEMWMVVTSDERRLIRMEITGLSLVTVISVCEMRV